MLGLSMLFGIILFQNYKVNNRFCFHSRAAEAGNIESLAKLGLCSLYVYNFDSKGHF